MTLSGASITLKTGWTLGYAEYGDPHGFPVLYFHGCPGSRLEAALTHETALRTGLRILGVDRPGYGLSPPVPGCTLTQWPPQVRALAKELGLSKIGILGVSGGGPYAVSCAAKLPDLVSIVGIVCGLGPLTAEIGESRMWFPTRLLFRAMRKSPALVSATLSTTARLIRWKPELAYTTLQKIAPSPDREILSREDVKQILLPNLREAVRFGAAGVFNEMCLFNQPWEFSLRDISVDVLLWHGEKDVTVPAASGRFLSEKITTCRSWFLPEEGHISLPINQVNTILGALSQSLRDKHRSHPAPS